MPGYIAAQVVGAFLGALLVYIVYKGTIDSYERAHDIKRGDPDSTDPAAGCTPRFPTVHHVEVEGGPHGMLGHARRTRRPRALACFGRPAHPAFSQEAPVPILRR